MMMIVEDIGAKNIKVTKSITKHYYGPETDLLTLQSTVIVIEESLNM